MKNEVVLYITLLAWYSSTVPDVFFAVHILLIFKHPTSRLLASCFSLSVGEFLQQIDNF